MAAARVCVHLGEGGSAVLLSRRKGSHALFRRLDRDPLQARHEDPLRGILADLDLAAVLARVYQVLHHLHVDLDEGTRDVECVLRAGLICLRLDLFKQILQAAGYDPLLLIAQGVVLSHHSVGLPRASLPVCEYGTVKALYDTLSPNH